MLLNNVPKGKYKIIKIDSKMKQLISVGFKEGQIIEVLNTSNRGPVIVAILQSIFAIGRKRCSSIEIERYENNDK